jgi:predicted nucleotidyltransferase
MLSIRPDQPINPLILAVMREVNEVAHKLGLEYFVAGAMARDILLTNVFGIATGLATRDVDFAVAVESWSQFEDVKQLLTARGLFVAEPKIAHRLYYKTSSSSQGTPLDIIPFRGVEQSQNTIKWPPEMAMMMNVVGYEEALASAPLIEVEQELKVRVVSLPGLTLLKLFAWADRGKGLTSSKDALDLATLFRRYAEAGNLDRLYGEELGLFASLGYDQDLASTRLLGKDVSKMITPNTMARVNELLNDDRTADRLVSHLSQAFAAQHDPIAMAQSLLEQFRAGLSGN